MNKNDAEILKRVLNIELSEDKIELFTLYIKKFLEKNAHTNLISKNDEKFLFEKHIFDSLAINKFERIMAGGKLLDIGTGGGFPSVPLAIAYENMEISAIDSIRKKINIIEQLKTELGLENLFPICDRVENLKEKKFDFVTTRAVAPVKTILQYAIPVLKEGGYFVAYKSRKAMEELKDADAFIKKSRLKVVDIIEYVLPLDEVYERNLIVFQKK